MAEVGTKTDGEVRMRVFRYVAHVAEMGEIAPSFTELSRALDVGIGAVQRALGGLTAMGLIQARADRTNHSRRCYRIVATGYETKGYGLGLEIGSDVDDAFRERIMDALADLAAEGGELNITRITRLVHVSVARFKRHLAELVAQDRIEVRTGALPGRIACRIVESGLSTAGFHADSPVPAKVADSIADTQAAAARAVERAMERARSRQRKRRKCLACGTEFTSFGPGNRLCVAHRHGSEAVTVHRIAR